MLPELDISLLDETESPSDALWRTDSEVAELLALEERRQQTQIELTAPKNYVSRAVWRALASAMTLTVTEGYPGNRFHAGTSNVDAVENLARERAKQLFHCGHANVQPHSGTQANHAALLGLLERGAKIVSMATDSGGHVSHGAKRNLTGQLFATVTYSVDESTGRLDYSELARICLRERPRMLIVGGSSYPREIDYRECRRIADQVGAILLADIAQVSGLVAAGVHPSPFPYADVVTSTTNKGLRGPQAGLVLTNDEDLARAIDHALFPGLQAGALAGAVAAKAVAFREAMQPDFVAYSEAVLVNARTFCEVMIQRGYDVLTDGTDSPLIMVDLRRTGLRGDVASAALERVGIICNKNLVPGDRRSPQLTSGLRFGTSGITTRGLRHDDVLEVAGLVADMLDEMSDDGALSRQRESTIKKEVEDLARQFRLDDLFPIG